MKKILAVMAIFMALMFSGVVLADNIGINYSTIQSNGYGAVNKNAFEGYGSIDLNDTVAATLKGTLGNNHDEPGYGVQLEAGVKVKLLDPKAQYVPWVQPALTYNSPETGGGYVGYVVDAGLDSHFGKWTVTPIVTYANDFSDSRKNAAYTAFGPKVTYALTDKVDVYARYRHQWVQDADDSNRFYIGTEYKF